MRKTILATAIGLAFGTAISLSVFANPTNESGTQNVTRLTPLAPMAATLDPADRAATADRLTPDPVAIRKR